MGGLNPNRRVMECGRGEIRMWVWHIYCVGYRSTMACLECWMSGWVNDNETGYGNEFARTVGTQVR